jgi:hypothetical protein
MNKKIKCKNNKMYIHETCTICLQEFKEIYILKSCNHSFCKECISQYISYNLQTLKCPLCRTDIHSHDIHNLYAEQELIYDEDLTYEERIQQEIQEIIEQNLLDELEIDRQIENYLQQKRIEEYEQRIHEELEIDRQIELFLEQERIEELEIELA